MKREELLELVDFCAQQHTAFDLRAWESFSKAKKEDLHAAALCLAATPWYGHQDDLVSLCAKNQPDWGGSVSAAVRDTRFDFPRFSGMLKATLNHEARVS